MKVKMTEKGVCSDGFKAAGVREGKYGLALIVADKVCASAGVYTKNSCKAAPVILTKSRVKRGLKAVVANSGCANACIKEGMKDAKKMAELTARTLGVKSGNIGVASTGIIGKRINLDLIEKLVGIACKKLSKTPEASLRAAKSIMTTDTQSKQFSVEYNGIQVGGICKGAGMISPNMATMLCFMTTNADLSRQQLQRALELSVSKSFNMLVIDGDMSTNDTVLLLASGKKKCSLSVFQKLLDYVTVELAKKIAKDGEGASKYLEFEVINARNHASAAKVAKAIASSPLVKTAFYGENPNWGRIISTIGSKIKFNPMKTTITFNSEKGSMNAFNQGSVGDLKKAREVLKAKEIRITVNLRQGKSKAKALSCDLTAEYVRINAGYS